MFDNGNPIESLDYEKLVIYEKSTDIWYGYIDGEKFRYYYISRNQGKNWICRAGQHISSNMQIIDNTVNC